MDRYLYLEEWPFSCSLVLVDHSKAKTPRRPGHKKTSNTEKDPVGVIIQEGISTIL